MLNSGKEKRSIRLIWWGIVAASAVAAAIGFAIVTASSTKTGALVEAFAAGSLLTMIADEMAPEAFKKSGKLTGLITTFGFILAVGLTSLDI